MYKLAIVEAVTVATYGYRYSQGRSQDLRKGGARIVREARKNFARKPCPLIKSRAPLIRSRIERS